MQDIKETLSFNILEDNIIEVETHGVVTSGEENLEQSKLVYEKLKELSEKSKHKMHILANLSPERQTTYMPREGMVNYGNVLKLKNVGNFALVGGDPTFHALARFILTIFRSNQRRVQIFNSQADALKWLKSLKEK